MESAEGRPSRRALHRRAVKKFNARRRDSARRRSAALRDGGLLDWGDPRRAALPLVGRWDFDFFFRAIPSDLLEHPPAAREAAPLYSDEERSLVVRAECVPRAATSAPRAALVQGGVQSAKSIHVRRLNGAPLLPMEEPMRAGTDLDDAPSNYLLPDATYGVHLHAQGFERDGNSAKRALFVKAVQEWHGGSGHVLVLSNGETMRRVFDVACDAANPLLLHVRRVGPTLLIDSHSDGAAFPPTRVREMRGRALLGKALYRIHAETTAFAERSKSHGNDSGDHGDPDTTRRARSEGPDATRDDAEKMRDGVVALPMHRIGSAALAKQRHLLSRYANIFRWEIGEMDVMVGIDTPLVIDRRDNTEYMLKLEDASIPMTPHELQRDALGCWFDATLANVAHVGIYVHNDGIIQRYEVRKVQDMLGLVEGRNATAAMNFTTNVLQWLVEKCTKDGTTYAVIRNYESDELEVYECAKDDRLEEVLTDGKETDSEVHEDEDDGDANDEDRITEDEEDEMEDEAKAKRLQSEREDDEAERLRIEENDRLNWGLANMCFRMGMHLKDSDEKTPDAISLLLRSFVINMQHPTRAGATQAICETTSALPRLIGRFIDSRRTILGEHGSLVQVPELHREAFLACGRFLGRLQEAVCVAVLPLAMRRTFLQCILSCAATLCVCVSRAMAEFTREHRTYARLRAAAVSRTESNVLIHSLIAKDLLQVVVEGILKLEQTIQHLTHAMELAQCTREPSGHLARLDNAQSPSPASPDSFAVINPKMGFLDIAPLESALWELCGDVVLLAMGDVTPFTVDVLVELSRRINAREERRTAHVESSFASHPPPPPPPPTTTTTPSPSSSSPLAEKAETSSSPDGKPTHAARTTLTWLASMKHDVVELSFTALRFFTKTGSQSTQQLGKVAQVYSHVGKHYFLTDRCTKALESLHRAESFLRAASQTPSVTAPNTYCCGEISLTKRDIHLTLGEVYSRMILIRSRQKNPSVPEIPLKDKGQKGEVFMMGNVQPLSSEEAANYVHAMDHFTQAGANEQLAAVLRQYASRQISSLPLSDTRADVAKGRSIFSSLQTATELSRSESALMNWETLRLSTAVKLHAELQRRGEEIASRWSPNAAAATLPEELTGIADEWEFLLQMALFGCTRVEGRAIKKNRPRAMGAVRESAAYALGALRSVCPAVSGKGVQEMQWTDRPLLARNVKVYALHCPHEWLCLMVTQVMYRVIQPVISAMPCADLSKVMCEFEEVVASLRNAKKKPKCDKSCPIARNETRTLIKWLESIETL